MIFLYRTEFDEILKLIKDSSVNVTGGKGIGKSTFLFQLRGHLGNDARLCQGVTAEELLRTLSDFRSGTILIDDLDRILAPENPTGEDINRIEKLIQEILVVARPEPGRNTRIVFTSIGAFDVLSPRAALTTALTRLPKSLIANYSNIFAQFHKFNLSPWARGTVNWRDSFEREFSKKLTSEQVLECWCDVILTVTGGHPLLFESVIGLLHNLIDEKAERDRQHGGPVPTDIMLSGEHNIKSIDDDLRRKRRLICRYVEDSLQRQDDGMRAIKSIIRHLRDSEFAIERKAFEYLQRCSFSDFCEAPNDMEVRNVLLMESALCCEDKDSLVYRIPGEMLRILIRRAGAGRKLITLEPDPSPSNRGALCVQNSNGTERIRLASGPWRILRILHERLDRLVTNEEILLETGLSIRAIQNVVTRLRAKLASQNIVITNERDKGYRMSIR